MKLFFLLFMLLPFVGCAYVGWHIWHILPVGNWLKAIVVTLLIAAFCLLFVNFAVGLDSVPMPLARAMYAVGTSAIIILLYLVMLFLVLDVLRLFGVVPSSLLRSSARGTAMVVGVMTALFVYANWNYHRKVRQPLEIATAKQLRRPVKIMLMSDLHLGYHNTRADLSKWIDIILDENPDYVLIAGDIVDISTRPLLEGDMAAEWRRLTVPVYACPGNHDYYADLEKSRCFFREAGIRLLRDESVELEEGIVVVGRDDRTNARRKSVAELMAHAGKDKFSILLDHQPYNLGQAEAAGVDFQFSGHTHYGQVWPISWIEDLIYEDAFGPLKKGDTQYYVTSGLGIWGGKFRIGTRSEYVVLTVGN
ncbi:MAG: metallophosphoesterase [Prevotella sp.]|nr:metallophosphoesterase [Prevotella sp.]